MKTKAKLYSIILLLAVSNTGVLQAVRPPDNSTTSQVTLDDSIRARMSDVDDMGLVIVWNGHGAETALQCEWTSGGNHGVAAGELGPYLTLGDNYIMFVLYNRVYRGGLFFSGGKWSYRFSLAKNGETVWSSSNHVGQNDAEIKYWKVFKATVSSSGRVQIDDTIDPEPMRVLKESMLELESKLKRSAGIARPF